MTFIFPSTKPWHLYIILCSASYSPVCVFVFRTLGAVCWVVQRGRVGVRRHLHRTAPDPVEAIAQGELVPAAGTALEVAPRGWKSGEMRKNWFKSSGDRSLVPEKILKDKVVGFIMSTSVPVVKNKVLSYLSRFLYSVSLTWTEYNSSLRWKQLALTAKVEDNARFWHLHVSNMHTGCGLIQRVTGEPYGSGPRPLPGGNVGWSRTLCSPRCTPQCRRRTSRAGKPVEEVRCSLQQEQRQKKKINTICAVIEFSCKEALWLPNQSDVDTWRIRLTICSCKAFHITSNPLTPLCCVRGCELIFDAVLLCFSTWPPSVSIHHGLTPFSLFLAEASGRIKDQVILSVMYVFKVQESRDSSERQKWLRI